MLEDISDYNRLHQMFESMTSVHNRDNTDIEGFGYRSDTVAPGVDHSTSSLPGITGDRSQAVGFKLLSGIFNQSKMLPLKNIPLTIELELVNDKDAPIVTPGVALPAGIFITANISND